MGSDADVRSTLAVDDGLELPEVGRWAKRKYHFFARYLQIFSTGMKNRYPQRHFIDLFAGAGKAKLRNTGEIVLTSSLLAATVPDPFTRIHLCELNTSRFNALNARIDRLGFEKAQLVNADANQAIGTIISDIPRGNCLSLAFIDPFGLHFDFETARALSDCGRMDLIVLLADNMDAMRNWSAYYKDNPDSNLDRFMGEGGWRERFNRANSDRFAEEFRLHYCERLSLLGYTQFDWKRVSNDRKTELYTLLFASKHARGAEFWKKISTVDEGGQRSLDFGRSE